MHYLNSRVRLTSCAEYSLCACRTARWPLHVLLNRIGCTPRALGPRFVLRCAGKLSNHRLQLMYQHEVAFSRVCVASFTSSRMHSSETSSCGAIKSSPACHAASTYTWLGTIAKAPKHPPSSFDCKRARIQGFAFKHATSQDLATNPSTINVGLAAWINSRAWECCQALAAITQTSAVSLRFNFALARMEALVKFK